MKSLFASPLRLLLVPLLLGLAGATLRAQYELVGTPGNTLYGDAVPTATVNTPPLQPGQPQFAGVNASSGNSSALNAASVGAPIPELRLDRYPSAKNLDSSGVPTGTGTVLERSRFGNMFAGGVPRYFLGDVVLPPNTQADRVSEADATYWRTEPVRPGETFVHPEGPADTQPPVAANAVPTVYYSPHADRVFASQSGRVSVTWVTRLPVATAEDPQLRYRYRDETFAVSSATQKPVRTIYWTERSFSAPTVSIPTGSIETVNPVYSANFPRTVAQEYQPVGISQNTEPNASLPAEKRTLWFEKTAGIGVLRAYNAEGRIFVEYLGGLKPGSLATHYFLGADIIEVVRSAPPVNVTVQLGEQLLPRDASGRVLPLDGGPELVGAPVTIPTPDAVSYYGTTSRADGRQIYYAEWENDNPDKIVFYWLQPSDASIHFLPAPSRPGLDIFWPVVRNHYAQVWPTDPLGFHAHYTTFPGGSDAATGLQFGGGLLPEVVFQDDRAQAESTLDITTQRLTVRLSADGVNRTLLKFSSGNELWYVRLYTQADGRAGFQEGDALPAVTGSVTVGQRVEAPAGYSRAGYIAKGRNYHPGAYLDPFTVGENQAATGAIIPVNALPGDRDLDVWWFKEVTPPSPSFSPFYVPAKIGRYTVSYPTASDSIVLASNAGSGDLSPSEIVGSLYVQNDRTQIGFNPNEEHALLLAGRVYALRDDLNNLTENPAVYTSQPFALLSYKSPVDQRPAMRVFKILRELDLDGTENDILFDYPITAGTILQGPMPLPLLPLPLDSAGRVKNREVAGTPDSAHQGPAHYDSFTLKDRKGYDWVYRGPHASASPSFGMQFYYPMRAGFFVPGLATQPEPGTALPYLRPLVAGVPNGDPVNGVSQTILYRPVWPENAPELRVAETLTLPKFGLPAVYGQSSARVLYQQSIANEGSTRPSALLHDPIREKTFALGAAGQLASLPTSIATTDYQGKTYFQRLPPHLQSRFYFDPLVGTKGALVLVGEFNDVPAGDDYVSLNVLSAEDRAALLELPSLTDPAASAWTQAINGLATRVETFIEDPNRAGTYKSDGNPVTVGADQLALVNASDTAVAGYALTATGTGSGWVTLLFGNGLAFTDEAEPVSMQVFRVSPRLYTGDLKVQPSANPLDEQMSLRHSGDFAARPDAYEFEWRFAPPQDGIAPGIYSYALTPRLGSSWDLLQNPGVVHPPAAAYATASTVPVPRTVTIKDSAFPHSATTPGIVLRSASGLDFTTGVPAQIIFGAEFDDLTGFVVYVNGVPALSFQAPAAFASVASTPVAGLVDGGLARQFTIDGNYFRQGTNSVEVALYTAADALASTLVDFQIHASEETDLVAAIGSPWTAPNGTLLNQVVVGGSPTAPLGSPLLVMSDNYFTVRYRAKTGTDNVAGSEWSRWVQPQLVEGWIKRALAAINPFNQRITDLYNNSINTNVSILTQAGARWEGNIALNLANINDFGLIEIYETLLNRAKNISVDSGYDYAPANDALLLAAGYLNDLYTILGNEAFADAANPTISIDDATTVTEVNTSRFSFESQVASVLDEELALLRGRDDFLAPGVLTAPAYNRLFWNYTRGINSGEALYAVNYNIREQAGAPTADGSINAADAQRMFPQGHGDAYGHYLTALTVYYKLLTNRHFTWTPRSEAVTVLGQTVQVDYQDERKFAAAAANLATTAAQALALTYRQSYKDDASAGWAHFRDGKFNSRTGRTRHWGLDEWTSRATQGAYYNWLVGNALLPNEDTDPNHTGIQVIDRNTVPELALLTTSAESFQTTIDNANARLNPLGLSPGAIAFDISPTELKAGKSHYEQVYERTLRSVLNAKGAFDQAATMTRSLRNQENQLDNVTQAIVDQEVAYVDQLAGIYGDPYPGMVGPGKIYAQGYAGPDEHAWFVIDRPSNLVDFTKPVTMQIRVPVNVRTFTGLAAEDIKASYDTETVVRPITISPSQVLQFADVWGGGASLGTRPSTGSLQTALLELYKAQLAVRAGADRAVNLQQSLNQRWRLYQEMIESFEAQEDEIKDARQDIAILGLVKVGLEAAVKQLNNAAEAVKDVADAASEAPPKAVGLATDATSGVRAAVKATGGLASKIKKALAFVAEKAADAIPGQQEKRQVVSEETLRRLGFTYEQRQVAYEFELIYQEVLTAHYEVAQLAADVQLRSEEVRGLLAEGERIKAEREVFRQRAAGLIQGYRTKDLTFRTFRNEALEQYRSLFDLASRYTYLAAKSYDYETGLLGSPEGLAVIDGIVSARSLGDLTGGVPQATVSTLGDAGLAGTLARLQADWSVAEGRLGINNPDQNGTLFSLRRELFRLLDDPDRTDDDTAWRQMLEQHIVANLLDDPDVAALANNLRKPGGGPVPGLLIPFATSIQHGKNFFGLPLAGGDHAYSPSNYATKIYATGLVLHGYVGMDPYRFGTPDAAVTSSTAPNALSATPYVYLLPAGTDIQLAPAFGDTGVARAWTVRDQALPLPFNLGATAFNANQFFNADGTLGERPWIVRKHPAFRPVDDPVYFYSSLPQEFTNSRLVGRSAWNGQWKLVIPAYTLLANETEALNRFVASVKDIELFLRTYSHSGN